MNTPDPVPAAPPVAIPWYRSRIMQGLVTVVVTQLVAKIEAHYHVDLSVLGISVDDAVQGVMNAIAAFAAYWAIHARVSPAVPIPQIVTVTAAKAEQLNTAPAAGQASGQSQSPGQGQPPGQKG
jgi:hypothetical protein